MLRPHELLQHPIALDLSKQVEIEVPDAWKREIKSGTIRILPLVNGAKQYPDGWCTYTYEHTQAPELESILGGINAKTPRAFGIWRQGNLLHFGFEQGPDDLNDNGLGLLVNSICYIARFTEDRPIVRTPSGFYSGVRMLDRAVIDRLVENVSRDLDLYLNAYLSEEERDLVRGKDRKELAAWYEAHRGFIHADKRGKFVIDQEAQQFGIAIDSSDFVPSLINASAETGERAALARALMQRYVPDGPGTAEAAEEWRKWWNANRDYMFFTDTGGFRWHIDPLAKQRGIPTKDLRGPARATLKPIEWAQTAVPNGRGID